MAFWSDIREIVESFDKRPLVMMAALSMSVNVFLFKIYSEAVQQRFEDKQKLQQVLEDKIVQQQHTIGLQDTLQRVQNALYQAQIDKLTTKP